MRTPGGQSQGATRPRPAVPRPATRPEDSGTRPSWPRALARSRLPRVGVSPGRAVYTNRARRGEFADRRDAASAPTPSPLLPRAAASPAARGRGRATALSSGLSSSPERGAVLTASQRTAGEPLPGTDGPQRLVLTLENTAGPLGQPPQTPTRPWAPAPATLRRCPLGAGCLLTQRALQNGLRRSKLTSSDARKMPDEAVLAARGRTWLPAPLTSGRSRQTVVSPLS